MWKSTRLILYFMLATITFGGLFTTTSRAQSTPGVAVYMTDTVKAEGDAGTTAFTFTVDPYNNDATAITMTYSVAGHGSTPADVLDFDGGVLPSGTINLAVGEDTQTLTINVSGDTLFELDETFAVTFTVVTVGVNLDTPVVYGNILRDNDKQANVSLVNLSDSSPNEGDGGAITPFTFAIDADQTLLVEEEFSYFLSTSQAYDDFTGSTSGKVVIPIGADTVSFTINVLGDYWYESDESFTVTIANSYDTVNMINASETATIVNDDPEPLGAYIYGNTVTSNEGNSGTTGFKFDIEAERIADGDKSFHYDVIPSGSNPVDIADFGGTFPSGDVTLLNGTASASFTVFVKGDATVEPDETFSVILSSPEYDVYVTGYLSVATITNDDTATVTVADVSKNEGNSGTTSYTFTAKVDKAVAGGFTVKYATSNGTATAGEDYVAKSGTLTFAGTAGEQKTFTVNVSGDKKIENDETFTVTLSDSSNSAVIATDTATGTIINDDVTFDVADNGSFEGDKSAGVPLGWTGKGTTIFRKDKQKCDKPEKDKYISYSGECAFMFKGNPTGEKTKINQKIEDLTAFTDGATVTFSVYVDKRSAKAGHPIGKLIVKYTNKEKQRLILRIPNANGYRLVSDSLTIDLTGRTLELVKMQFRNRLANGKFFIDDASLTITPATALKQQREALPVPDAPDSFRD